MAHDVFISYSSKDKTVADATCAVLEAKGVRCWMAPRDIMPGSEWGAAIVEAISGARVMVLIYTSASNASPQVRREVERAVARGLHVIPFRVEDVPMSPALEYFISSPHWLDALSPPLERHLDHLGRIIRAVLDAQKPLVPEELPGTGSSTPGTGTAGWSHGPPPGAFAAPAGGAGGAGTFAAGAAAGTSSAAGARGPREMPAKTKLMIGGGVAGLVVVGAVVFAVTRPGGSKNTAAAVSGVQPAAPSDVAGDLAQRPARPLDAAPALPGEVPKPTPVAPTPPAPREQIVAPLVPAPPPPTPARPAEPGEQDVKRFWDLLAQGSPRIPRLQEVLDDYPNLADRKSPAGNTPLYEAARAGQGRVVSLLLHSGADRKAASAGNNTPLHGLAASGLTDPALVEALAPGNLDARNADGDAPLHVAVAGGHADTARLIAEAGADVNAPDRNGRTPLQLAFTLDDAAKAQAAALALVGAGAKTDAADKRGNTPLHVAATSGNAALLTAMIDKGAKVDRAGQFGRTPIHLAAQAGKVDSIKALLARRAAVDVIDDQGNTPLHLAAALPETAAAEALLAGGAKVTTATKERQTPLHVAAAAGNTVMIELLMRSGGAEILTKGKPPSPIDAAEKAGKKDVALLLRRLEFPAMLRSTIDAPKSPVPPRLVEMIRKDPNLAGPQGSDGRNALHLCAASGNAALAAELIKINPALVKAFSASEETPLHVAAANKQTAVARLLLASGASVRATTRNGETPLHVAAKSAGSGDVMRVLLDAGADPALTNRQGRTPAELAADPAGRALLAAAQEEADALRGAWSAVTLEGRSFDVKAPGAAQPLRVRFRDRRNFTAEGDVSGTYKRVEGTYTKGALTLAMDCPEGPLFPGIAGTTYSGKVNVAAADDTRFGWKVGAAEIIFERP